MALIQTIINRFDGGIQNDIRLRIQGASQVCKNFDVFTNTSKMSPYFDTDDGDSSASTSKKQNFAVALDASASTYRLYALGVVSGQNYAEVKYKDLTSGSTPDFGDALWGTLGTTAKHQGSSAAVDFGLFTYYARTGLIYCASSGDNQIMAYDPDGLVDFAESGVNAVTMTTVSEGLVHSKDDILYIPYDNKIMKFDGSTWTDAAITVPTHMVINSICEYGNYIAIAATPKSGVGKTFVYLWNRDSTLTTLSESIDWGTGQIKALEEIEGFLMGISYYGGVHRRQNDRIVFRYYAGGTPKTFLQIQADVNTVLLPAGKQKIDERLYFSMKYTKDSTIHAGVWSVRFHEGQFALVQEREPDTGLTLTENFIPKGFIKVGDILFQTYINTGGGTFVTSKTNEQTAYADNSVWASIINPNIEAKYMSRKKQLIAVSMSYETLPTAGSAKLEYKIDGGSWTEIFTETTDSAVNTEAVVDVNGAQFAEGREYEFRITSTGGAEITELKYKWDTLDTQI